MKFQKIFLTLLAVLLLNAGCISTYNRKDIISGQINVFGVELFSDVDYRNINGVIATEEPCLRGYERSFDTLDLVIGYGFDKKIRKITTRNLNTSLFGIKPGMAFEEGKKMILQAGFSEFTPPFNFRMSIYSLTFLVDGNNKIFGLTLELIN